MRKSGFLAFIAVILAVSVLAGCASQPAAQPKPAQPAQPAPAAPKPIEINYGHGFMPETPQARSAARFKELVEQRTANKVKVNLFPGGQLGSAQDMFQSLQMGTQQVALLPTARISGFAPKLQLFDLPFLFPSREVAYKIFDGPMGAELLKTLQDKKVMGVAIYEDGFKHFTSSKAITKLEDFKGTKFRTMESPIIMEQFKSLGATPTPIDFAELYNALQQKVVDGQENPLVTIYGMKFYEVQKNLIMSGHAYLGHVLLFSQSWFSGLPQDVQKVLVDTGKEIAAWERQQVVDGEKDNLAKIKAFGTNIIELSDKEKARMREAVKPVYKVAENVIGKDLIDMALAEIAKLSK